MSLRKQAVLNAAAKGLAAQQSFSTGSSEDIPSATSCRYRSTDGHKCAVGFLIPDRKYDPKTEGRGAGHDDVVSTISTRYLPEGDALQPEDRDFLSKMQVELHDGLMTDLNGRWNESVFKRQVATFARNNNLKNPLE